VSSNGRCRYILCQFGQFSRVLVYFITIVFNVWSFGIFSPFWYAVPRKIWQPIVVPIKLWQPCFNPMFSVADPFEKYLRNTGRTNLTGPLSQGTYASSFEIISDSANRVSRFANVCRPAANAHGNVSTKIMSIGLSQKYLYFFKHLFFSNIHYKLRCILSFKSVCNSIAIY
jgi:hypothetical protein